METGGRIDRSVHRYSVIRYERKCKMPEFIQYEHHGKKVWVNKDLVGKHRGHCLCFFCAKFRPGVPEVNCPIANLNYAVCLAHNMVLPVYECPEFDMVINVPEGGVANFAETE